MGKRRVLSNLLLIQWNKEILEEHNLTYSETSNLKALKRKCEFEMSKNLNARKYNSP